MLGQQGQILFAIAQWRQMNVEHVETVEQVLAQMAIGNGLAGVLVRSSDHPHVHRSFRLAAQPAHFMIFQYAQQLRLRGRRHFADFVQQQRAAVRQFEAADSPLGGTGERTPLVAENFALHQGLGDRRTVDGHKGTTGSRRKLVQRARQTSLPVPVSPVINTDAGDGATCSIRRMISRIGRLSPTRSPSRPASRSCRVSAATLR